MASNIMGDEMVSVKWPDDIRVSADPTVGRLTIRPGRLALIDVLVVIVAAAIVLPVTYRWGKVDFAIGAVACVWFVAVTLGAYVHGGICVGPDEVHVAAAFATNTTEIGSVAGIGVLYVHRHPAFRRNYRQIAILRSDGQWFYATGVWARSDRMIGLATLVSDTTGWALASSPEKALARTQLIAGEP
jgi:hypothetical protein